MACFGNSKAKLQEEINRLEDRLKFLKEIDNNKTNQLVRAWAEISNLQNKLSEITAKYDEQCNKFNEIDRDVFNLEVENRKLKNLIKHYKNKSNVLKRDNVVLSQHIQETANSKNSEC